MEELKDYEFLDHLANDYPTTPVKILTGKYKDVIVCYGRVRIVEQEDDINPLLQFSYQIMSPESQKYILKDDKEFLALLTDILQDMMMEIKLDDMDEIRNNDNKESDTE